MGVLSPLPRVDHKVAEAGACRSYGLCFPGFNRSGLDDGHQNSFRRVIAENNVRVLALSHRLSVKIPVFDAKAAKLFFSQQDKRASVINSLPS